MKVAERSTGGQEYAAQETRPSEHCGEAAAHAEGLTNELDDAREELRHIERWCLRRTVLCPVKKMAKKIKIIYTPFKYFVCPVQTNMVAKRLSVEQNPNDAAF